MSAALPYDSRVEYLESTGTQWIDTGMVLTSADAVRVKVHVGTAQNGIIFGARTSSKSNSFFAGVAKTSTPNTVVADFFNYETSRASVTLQTGSIYEIEISKSVRRVNASKNENPIGQTFSTPGNCYLFSGYNIGNSSTWWSGVGRFVGRCFYFRSVRNGRPTLDLIPVRVGDTGYMYDRISGKMFGNDGEGSFLLGPDIGRYDI